jgi:hypothetical protein
VVPVEEATVSFCEIYELLRFDVAAGDDAISIDCFAPFAVNVGNIWSQSADGNLEEALPFRRLKQDAFFLGETVANRAASNPGFGW